MHCLDFTKSFLLNNTISYWQASSKRNLTILNISYFASSCLHEAQASWKPAFSSQSPSCCCCTHLQLSGSPWSRGAVRQPGELAFAEESSPKPRKGHLSVPLRTARAVSAITSNSTAWVKNEPLPFQTDGVSAICVLLPVELFYSFALVLRPYADSISHLYI